MAVEVSPLNSDLVVFSTLSDAYKSERGGVPGSWQEITPDAVSLGVRRIVLSPHNEQVYVLGTHDQGFYYTRDGGLSWMNNRLEGFFEQRLHQGSDQYLAPEVATAFNPDQYVLNNVSVIVFDALAPDTFYVAGRQVTRAGFGVVRITNAGRDWERLPLAGLSHRNVFDLVIDSAGEFLYAGTLAGTFRLGLR